MEKVERNFWLLFSWLSSPPTVCRLTAQNLLPYLLPYPYLNPSIPLLLNPLSLWILSQPLDSLSVIQLCVFFKCLSTVDFGLWMPWAPKRDLRRPVVWPSISHILPAAREPDSIHPAHEHTSQVLTPSRGH